jgi:hypothetical protein
LDLRNFLQGLAQANPAKVEGFGDEDWLQHIDLAIFTSPACALGD